MKYGVVVLVAVLLVLDLCHEGGWSKRAPETGNAALRFPMLGMHVAKLKKDKNIRNQNCIELHL